MRVENPYKNGKKNIVGGPKPGGGGIAATALRYSYGPEVAI